MECISGVLDFLEANLFVSSSRDVEISVKPPVFHCSPGASHPASQQRMLDHFSPNTPPMLASFVPNQVLKAMHYAFGSEIIFFNICCLMLLLTSNSISLVVPFPRAMQCCSDGSESPRYEQTKYSDRQVEKRQRERAHMASIIPETQATLSVETVAGSTRGDIPHTPP